MNTSLSQDCYVPNCEEATWKLTSSKDSHISGPPNTTKLQYFIPLHSKVLGLTEVKLYTWTNLFADFGGFLGLFLGDSILSVSHLILGLRVCLTLLRHCVKGAFSKVLSVRYFDIATLTS